MMSTTSARGCAFFSQAPNQIFSPEQFQGDEALMIEAAEDFSRNEVLPVAERLEKQEEGLMPGLIRKAGELGFCGIDTPEAYGGLGLGKNLAARILEHLSFDASFSVTLGVTSGIAQVGLTLFGSEEQKQKYLPPLSSGEWIGAYALSEPNSGSDALAASARAEVRGSKYVLNGTKMWISNAKWADFFLVMAQVHGESFSAFLVERDFPGVEVSREEHKMGLKGSSTARLLLENAEVPKENLLYEVGLGHQVAFNALNLGRFKLSSMCLGPCHDAIAQAAAYAQDRHQFGEAIANFGLIKKKFALMAALYFVAESMIYRTGRCIDEGFAEMGGSIDGNRKAAEEFSVECSACKVFASEVEAIIVDEALQVFGGYGFTEEFPMARHYRDARVSRIYEGTNEINRVFIASRLKRRSKEGRASLDAAGDSFISELAGEVIRLDLTNQIVLGAASDLVLLTYAEQSARIRAGQEGPSAQLRYQCALPWLNSRAAEAYQIATGKSVSMPPIKGVEFEALADSVYERRGL